MFFYTTGSYNVSINSSAEGPLCLWNGSSMVISRAVLMTLSQVDIYLYINQWCARQVGRIPC